MVLSSSIILSNSPIASPSLPTSTSAKLETFSLKNDGVIRIRGVTASSEAPRNRKIASCSASKDGNASVEADVPFPADYTELLEQARVAVELALLLKGLTLYHLKSHLQKYRLGQQTRKQNEELHKENTRCSYVNFSNRSSGPNTSYRDDNEGGNPIAEALRRQIEIQKRLEEQIEVQKKLQMRIEAQGKYLQTVLEKAQRNLSVDGSDSLEASRAQLTEFNSALTNFMENMNKDSKENIVQVNDFYSKSHGSDFHYQEVVREENRDQKHKVEGGSIHFDLNIKGSNDLVSAAGAEMDANMISYRL